MIVVIETSLGTMKAELAEAEAPVTVENFLRYADEGYFDGTIFHRVIPGFMIQGGGFSEDMKQKPTHEAIANEAGNGLKNLQGTLAMARTSDVNSATAQFFINTADNGFLDHRDETSAGFGYAVFGRLIEGSDIAMQIQDVATKSAGHFDDVPVTPVVIQSVRRAEGD
jgi:cyclophilin family peptidyl-prolyl cis-trans isomerase